MDPQWQCCHNRDCWAYGRHGDGHIRIHSRQERRYHCDRCGQTFSATQGTALYQAHKPPEAVEQVVTLLAHGCPVQAFIAAFGWDEQTVARYQAEAGVAGPAGCGRSPMPPDHGCLRCYLHRQPCQGFGKGTESRRYRPAG